MSVRLVRFDLLGKPIVAREPVPAFYCCGCSGTHSRMCKKHRERHCAAGKRRCNVGFCEACDLRLPAKFGATHD